MAKEDECPPHNDLELSPEHIEAYERVRANHKEVHRSRPETEKPREVGDTRIYGIGSSRRWKLKNGRGY